MNHLLVYLERVSPAALQELRRRHKGQEDTLRPKLVLGVPGSVTGAEDKGRLEAMYDLAQLSMLSILGNLLKQTPRLLRRISAYNWAKLSGGFVATASAAVTAALALLELGPKFMSVATALVAMLGGVATLVAGALERSPAGARTSLIQDVERMICMRAEVEQMQRELGRRHLFPVEESGIKQMLARLDQLAPDMLRLDMSYPGPGRKR